MMMFRQTIDDFGFFPLILLHHCFPFLFSLGYLECFYHSIYSVSAMFWDSALVAAPDILIYALNFNSVTDRIWNTWPLVDGVILVWMLGRGGLAEEVGLHGWILEDVFSLSIFCLVHYFVCNPEVTSHLHCPPTSMAYKWWGPCSHEPHSLKPGAETSLFFLMFCLVGYYFKGTAKWLQDLKTGFSFLCVVTLTTTLIPSLWCCDCHVCSMDLKKAVIVTQHVLPPDDSHVRELENACLYRIPATVRFVFFSWYPVLFSVVNMSSRASFPLVSHFFPLRIYERQLRVWRVCKPHSGLCGFQWNTHVHSVQLLLSHTMLHI